MSSASTSTASAAQAAAVTKPAPDEIAPGSPVSTEPVPDRVALISYTREMRNGVAHITPLVYVAIRQSQEQLNKQMLFGAPSDASFLVAKFVVEGNTATDYIGTGTDSDVRALIDNDDVLDLTSPPMDLAGLLPISAEEIWRIQKWLIPQSGLPVPSSMTGASEPIEPKSDKKDKIDAEHESMEAEDS